MLFGEVAPVGFPHLGQGGEVPAEPLFGVWTCIETVPEIDVTRHAGEGKAKRCFLRGFNLDHGTDFALTINGMPLSMSTHAHGQGYADLNLLLPELLDRVDYFKGTYTARNGDLSSFGSADFNLYHVPPRNFATGELRDSDGGTIQCTCHVVRINLGPWLSPWVNHS